MKKVLPCFLICFGAILFFTVFLPKKEERSGNIPMTYTFDYKNFEVRFTADRDYVFTLANSEYGKLRLPDLAEETDGVQVIVVALEDLPIRDGEFIYLHLTKKNVSDPDLRIYIYEILYQSEKELYIARCKDHVGGIYEQLDVYNPKTGALSSSR